MVLDGVLAALPMLEQTSVCICPDGSLPGERSTDLPKIIGETGGSRFSIL